MPVIPASLEAEAGLQVQGQTGQRKKILSKNKTKRKGLRIWPGSRVCKTQVHSSVQQEKQKTQEKKI